MTTAVYVQSEEKKILNIEDNLRKEDNLKNEDNLKKRNKQAGAELCQAQLSLAS